METIRPVLESILTLVRCQDPRNELVLPVRFKPRFPELKHKSGKEETTEADAVDGDPGLYAGILESPLYLTNLVNISDVLFLEVSECAVPPVG